MKEIWAALKFTTLATASVLSLILCLGLSANGIQTGPFAASWANLVVKFFQLECPSHWRGDPSQWIHIIWICFLWVSPWSLGFLVFSQTGETQVIWSCFLCFFIFKKTGPYLHGNQPLFSVFSLFSQKTLRSIIQCIPKYPLFSVFSLFSQKTLDASYIVYPNTLCFLWFPCFLRKP